VVRTEEIAKEFSENVLRKVEIFRFEQVLVKFPRGLK
jgi:hypothetical protein